MNFVKKNFKLIVGIVIAAILISGISVYATTTYLATQVNYTRNNTTISVASALDELYTMKKDEIKTLCDALNSIGIETNENEDIDSISQKIESAGSNRFKILETGSVNTGTIAKASALNVTFPLKNTYTSEQNAFFIIEGESGSAWEPYVQTYETKIVGNSTSRYVYNPAGSQSGSWNLNYMVIELPQ